MILAQAILISTFPLIWLKVLPNLPLITALTLVALFFFVFSPKSKVKNIFLFLFICALSFTWSVFYSKNILSWSLPKSFENKPILIAGNIDSLVLRKNSSLQFIFKTKAINSKAVSTYLKLNWNKPNKKIHAGEAWQLVTKLKRPHENLNAGSLDREKWYFIHGIRAKGQILNSERNIKIKSQSLSFLALRENISLHLENALKGLVNSGVLSALIIGDQSHLTFREKTTFKNTGTSHLMAISGLHVGLVASVCFMFSRVILQLFPNLFLWVPAQSLAAIAGLFGAFFYSGLAGFSFSTQRALVMITCVLLRYWLPWKISFLDAISIALVIVLLIQPVAILDVGFWLSFSAVAVLGYAMVYREKNTSLWWRWGRAQWACCIGLLPISCWYFQQIPLSGFFANLIAIPWVSFIVVPMSFIGTIALYIYKPIGILVLKYDLILFSWLFKLLSIFSDTAHIVLIKSIPSLFIYFVSMVGAALILSPKNIPVKLLGVLFFIPLFFYHTPRPKFGESKISILDVGQGLATVVQTQHHTLIYDTGPQYSKNFDAGKAMIIPFLHYHGITKLDAMIISHGDSDHIGGARSVLKVFQTSKILTSAPHKLRGFNPSFCYAGQHWVWDGVRFEILYPQAGSQYRGNSSSCVLKVSASGSSALFTGDIEQLSEHALVDKFGEQLKSSVLIVPHHGSKTSSSLTFLKTVKPSVAVFSYGYLNRYHHPSPSVLKSYLQNGTNMFNTVEGGEIDITLGDKLEVSNYRILNHHIWSQ